MARVYHAELWGRREAKYGWLDSHDVKNTPWQEIHPSSGLYLFVPRDEAALERYNRFVPVTDIFPVHSVGIVTSRDRFVIDFDRDALDRHIRQFLDPALPDELVRQTFRLKDKQGWSLGEARRAVRADPEWQSKIVRCLYRPFDVRWLFYHRAVVERGREEVMRHLLMKGNLALIVPRQHKGDFGAFVTACPGTHKTVAVYDINYYFPLLLYEGGASEGLAGGKAPEPPKTNVRRPLIDALRVAHGFHVAHRTITDYVYGVTVVENPANVEWPV